MTAKKYTVQVVLHNNRCIDVVVHACTPEEAITIARGKYPVAAFYSVDLD